MYGYERPNIAKKGKFVTKKYVNYQSILIEWSPLTFVFIKQIS